MFDENRDEKIYWSDFKAGIKVCMFGSPQEVDDFIFRFFDLGESTSLVYLMCSDGEIDFVEFRSIMNHLPPSIFFVTLKTAEERSDAAHSCVCCGVITCSLDPKVLQ